MFAQSKLRLYSNVFADSTPTVQTRSSTEDMRHCWLKDRKPAADFTAGIREDGVRFAVR